MWIYFVLFCVCFFLFYLSMLCITNTICNPVGIDGMTCSSLQIFTCTNNTNPFAQPSADWQKDVLLGTIFTCTNHFKFYFILILGKRSCSKLFALVFFYSRANEVVQNCTELLNNFCKCKNWVDVLPQTAIKHFPKFERLTLPFVTNYIFAILLIV